MPSSRPGASSSQAQDIDVETADHTPPNFADRRNGKSSVRSSSKPSKPSRHRHHDAYATTSNLHPFWGTKKGLATIAFAILIIIGAIVGGVVGGTVGRSPDHKLPSKAESSTLRTVATTATSHTAGSTLETSAKTTSTDTAVPATVTT